MEHQFLPCINRRGQGMGGVVVGAKGASTSEAKCLRALRDARVLTVSQLSSLTGLSRPTVVTVCDRLVSRGLAAEHRPAAGASTAETGRPPRTYSLQSHAALSCGIEIGRSHLDMALTDLRGEMLLTQTWDLSADLDGQERVNASLDLITACFEGHGIDGNALEAVVVATSGIIDAEGRVRMSSRIPGWTGTSLGAQMAAGLQSDVRVENDVNMFALAELHLGRAQQETDLFYLYLDAGYSSALVLRGELYRGAHEAAGEVLQESWGRLGVATQTEESPGEYARTVTTQAQQGDENALAILENLGRSLAGASRSAVAILDPGMVILGGQWAAGDLLTAPYVAELRSFANGLPVPEVASAYFSQHGAVLGALTEANLNLSSRLFGGRVLPPLCTDWRFGDEQAQLPVPDPEF